MSHNSLKISSLSLKLIKLHIFKIMYLFTLFNVFCFFFFFGYENFRNFIFWPKLSPTCTESVVRGELNPYHLPNIVGYRQIPNDIYMF